jgi:hypothetical protein
VTAVIGRLNKHKNDDISSGLSTDYLTQAGHDLATHIEFKFTCMARLALTILHRMNSGPALLFQYGKKHHTTDSNNFRGTALSSVFCKVFDNVILDKFHDKLCSSELHFGFKFKNSTNMCTMVLKETISYYIKHQSSVYCTFLDASRVFDRVHYC